MKAFTLLTTSIATLLLATVLPEKAASSRLPPWFAQREEHPTSTGQTASNNNPPWVKQVENPTSIEEAGMPQHRNFNGVQL